MPDLSRRSLLLGRLFGDDQPSVGATVVAAVREEGPAPSEQVPDAQAMVYGADQVLESCSVEGQYVESAPPWAV